MIVSLPWPSAVLSPNARVHWARLARAKRAYRQSGYYAARPLVHAARQAGEAAMCAPLAVALTFHPPTAHRRDEDNLIAQMKAALDGIADALGLDDSAFRLRQPVIGAVRRGGEVRVEITAG